MRWSGAVVMALMATLYFLLSQNSEGMLAAFGYGCAALLFILAIMNILRPHK
jgi:hypothetical protein